MVSVKLNNILHIVIIPIMIILLAVVLLTGATAAQAATGTIQGVVENEIGESISNANITADGTKIAVTSDDGSYKNDSVSVGIKNISVNHPKYDQKYREQVTVTTNSITTEEFTLKRTTAKVGGVVRSGPVVNLQPVSNVRLSIEHKTDQDLIEGSDALQMTTTTNETGFYQIDVPTGEVDVIVDQEGFTDARRTKNVPNGGLDLDITLDNTIGTVNGTVSVANGGPPISGANVSVAVDPDNWTGIDAEDIIDKTGSNGQYSVVAPSGTRTLTVEAETFQPKERPGVTILPDQTARGVDFELSHNQLRIDNVVPQTVQSDDSVTVEYTYNGDFETVEFTVGQGQIVPTKIVDVDDSAGEITFKIPSRSEIEDGNYTVTLATPRRTATETIRVLNPVDPETVGVGELGEESYRAPAGGFIEISTGGEYMLIGGDTPTESSDDITQYFDILYVEGGSTTINTRLVGTNVSSERAYGDGVKSYAHSIGADSPPRGDFAGVSFSDASTLAEFRQRVGIDSRSTPLQTGRYRILAGENGRVTVDGGTPRFRKPVGRSNLVLTQPRLEAVNTYVLPPDSANAEDVAGPSDDATESNTIADGERLLIEIQATGMYGAMIDDPTAESIPPKKIAQLLEKNEGVTMDLSTWYYEDSENAEANLQFDSMSSSDVYIIPDKTTDQWDDETTVGEDTLIGGLYILVDTRGEAFSAPAYGDVMQFKTAYESPAGGRYLYQDVGSGIQPEPFAPAVTPEDGVGHFPYLGASDTTITVNSTIEYMEPSIQYGRTTFEGDLIVPAETGGQVLGSTTLAPGTEATIQFIDQSRPDPELVTIEEVTIEEDRTFTASADFSALDSGDQVTVEFYTAGRLPGNRVIDRRGARVVENISNIANYQITNFTSPVEVQQRSSLTAVKATITNTGELTGQQVVKFSIDGEPIRNESLRLSGNGSKTLDLSGQFVTLPVGTYEYTVRTDNDEQTGEIRVTEPTSGTTITSEESTTATTTSPLDENDVPSDDDGGSTPSGLFGFVGVSGRDVALGTAITGAAHVLGYWT